MPIILGLIALSFLVAFVAWIALVIVTLITDPLNFWAWMGVALIVLMICEGRRK